jgi:hypothetical protein
MRTKNAVIGVVLLTIGVSAGSFLRPSAAHAQKGLRPAHVIEVNMDPSVNGDFTFNGTPVSLSCLPGRAKPRCFVLVQGN